jgi:hypothetical protein
MEKNIFLRLNFDDSPADLKAGEYTYALNLIPLKEGVGASGGRENIPGTEEVSIILSDGVSTCIGSVVDKRRNQLIFFIHNDQGNHTICKWEYGKTEAQTLLQWDGFNFDKDHQIRANIVDRYLVWTDGLNNARIIDLDRISSGLYGSLSEFKISFIKRGPLRSPYITRVNSIDAVRSYISDVNLQFATRFVYFDNQISPLSPYSDLSPAEPIRDLSSESNSVRVTVSLSSEESELIKEVHVLVRTSNNENFSIAESIKVHPGVLTYEYSYIGDKNGAILSDEEQNYSTNPIPESPKNNAYMQNRLFLSGGTIGQDDLGDISLQASVDRSISNERSHIKEGGAYEVGLILYDENMKSVGVVKSKNVEVPYDLSSFSSQGYVVDSAFFGEPRILCKPEGTPPLWAKYFSFAIKKEKTKDIYFQCPANVYFYVADNRVLDKFGTVLETTAADAGQFISHDRIYLKSRPIDHSNYSYLHLHLPKNIPFLPDTSYHVKILNDVGVAVVDEPIIDVLDGNKIVTNNFGITDFTLASTMSWFVEVYAKKTQGSEELFFETGDVYSISSFNQQRALPGDAYTVAHSWENTAFDFDTFKADIDYDRHLYFNQKVESPSPCFSAVSGSGAELHVENHKYTAKQYYFLGLWVGTASNSTTVSAGRVGRKIVQTSNYVLDYSKIASSLGRPTIKPVIYKKIKLDNSIRYGSTYVENSTVNGLANFSALDDFNLGSEQGRNSLLIKADGVLLAINERSTTSIYVNEAFINTADGQRFLAKTEGVISDDRELKGSFGTVNPESIATNGDVVYWVDLFKGEALRYNNGLTPIASTYKAKTYFRRKCDERINLLNLNPKIYGGYDPYLDMYIVTFAPVGNLPGETIGFSETYKGWVSFFSFIPERYSNINTELLSFKNGTVYRHRRPNVGYNKFYGEEHPSVIEFISNPEVEFEKTWENLAIDSGKAWKVDISNEKGQVSDLVPADFRKKGSAFYADILRDKNTPADLMKPGQLPLRSGRELRSQTLTVRLETDSKDFVNIQSAYTGYLTRSGQLIN